MSELHAQLGAIPLERIRLVPTPGTATERDALELSAKEDRLFELVNGVLVEKAMGWYESLLAGLMLTRLNNFLEANDLGQAFGADATLRILPHLVRIPDVCFISWDRLPDQGVTRRPPVPAIAPDLAIEVLSESNTPAEIDLKLHAYFAAGARLVWIVDPASRTANSFSGVGSFEAVAEDGVLAGGDVLPGFHLPLKELFARADRKRPTI